jgi:hypothetical protein
LGEIIWYVLSLCNQSLNIMKRWLFFILDMFEVNIICPHNNLSQRNMKLIKEKNSLSRGVDFLIRKKLQKYSSLLVLCGLIAVSVIIFNGCKQPRTSESRTFPVITIPPMYITMQAQAEYVAIHYWDNFNFNDTTWVGSFESVTEQAIVEYISIIPYAQYNVICLGIQELLDKADINPVMYTYFSSRLEYYFSDPASTFRTDEYYVPVLEHMIASKSLDEPRKARPNTILPLVNKNRPGMQAANINFTGVSGAKSQLTNVKSDYILVIFYNFDCEDCNVVKKLIEESEVINEMQKQRKLAILAIYPGANMEGWKVSSPQIPASWINGYDHDEEIVKEGTYVLRSIPTLYLMDKEYMVIMKEPSVEYVEFYFDSILNPPE